MRMLRSFYSNMEILASTSSKNNKILHLQSMPPGEVALLSRALNPMEMFGVTSKALPKASENVSASFDTSDVMHLLDMLASRQYTGNEAISEIQKFLINSPQACINAFGYILDKNPQAGVGISTFNKAFPDKKIKEFKCQLCESYNMVKKEVPFDRTVGSRKLDGLRCLLPKVGSGPFQALSREGRPFTSLSVLEKELNETYKFAQDVVFDGECCIIDEDGNEDFAKASSSIRKKDIQVPNPHYKIFDILTLNEFKSGTSNRTFAERYTELAEIVGQGGGHHSYLKQFRVKTKADIEKFIAMAVEKNWEGLVFRDAAAKYIGKRSKSLQKQKIFKTHEFTVTSVYEGKKGTKNEGKLGGAIVEGDFEGTHIVSGVGSGFKGPQRIAFWTEEGRKKLIGAELTIRFFEVSLAEGATVHSLRFPAVKDIHFEGRQD